MADNPKKPFLGLSSLHRPWTINPSILERMPYPRRMDFSFFNVNRSPVNINQINQEKAQNLHMEMAKLPRPPELSPDLKSLAHLFINRVKNISEPFPAELHNM
ncbi:hypothetical protein CIHG_00706 [Coccidioides immitis H538.4]|nr:hypothetical protein CIRG_03125 [Coccidioides immitis RMSCC 2394]KMU82924.1 hypothetical protein CIHG_00706 [Coccidioides immitis H538.4]